MAKKRKKSKKSFLTIKTIFNAPLLKLEKLAALFFFTVTIVSIIYSIYSRNISFFDGAINMSGQAEKLIGINAFAFIISVMSSSFEERKAVKKGVILAVGLCAINMFGAGQSNKLLSKFSGILTTVGSHSRQIDYATHVSILVSSIVFIVIIALAFCKKAK